MATKYLTALILISAISYGCGGNSHSAPGTVNGVSWDTLSSIHKQVGTYLPNRTESTPVVFDGRLITVTSVREGASGVGLEFHDLKTGELLSTSSWDYGLTSALVHDNTLYVFGTSSWATPGNRVVIATVNSDFNINNEQTVLTAGPNETIYNTSVSEAEYGFVMAYEFDAPNFVHFSARFAVSYDLHNWTTVGNIWEPDRYAACPTIRYSGGYYYVTYLRKVGDEHITFIGRTADFYTFETSTKTVIAPNQLLGEGTNASDLDMVESNGVVYFTYAVGNQTGWSDLKTAVYLDTLDAFFDEYWP